MENQEYSSQSKDEDPSNFSPDDRVNRLNEALKHAENIENLTNSITVKGKPINEDEYTKIINHKKQLIDEMTLHENQLKDKRIELEVALKKIKQTERNIAPFSKYDTYLNNHEEAECTFVPKVNPNAGRPSSKMQSNENVNDMLHRDAHERIQKKKNDQVIDKKKRAEVANSNKIDNKSLRLVMRKIEKALRNVVADNEAPDQKGQINFENLGTIFHNIGCFQNLEFAKDQDSNRSSLSLNELKIKPERLMQEISFHENFYNLLNSVSDDPDLVPAELVFNFLMVLVEAKAPVKSAAGCLQEIMEAFLAKKEDNPESGSESPLKRNQEEKKTWSFEKVIIEFRKLFDDKTTFMNLYNSGSILGKSTMSLEKTSIEDQRIPQINKKSKEIDASYSTENYIAKVITSKKSDESKNQLRNRYDILYEHHKFLADKFEQDKESLTQERMKAYTFTPKITEYKPTADKDKDPSKSSARKVEDPNAKRHDVLYKTAKVHKEKLEVLKNDVKQKQYEREMENCTFEPALNHNYEHSSIRTKEFFEGLPLGFKKTIERMQTGEAKRKHKQNEKEAIPRGENYEKNREADFKPPEFLKRPKIKRDEVLVYVDVNVAPGKTGRIGIHRGDDPKELALNFSRTYSLNATMRESLEKLLQSYIDNYFENNAKKKDTNETDEKNDIEEADEGEQEENETKEEEGENNGENGEEGEEGEQNDDREQGENDDEIREENGEDDGDDESKEN